MNRSQDAGGDRTEISVTSMADCPFSIAQEYATEYLRRAEEGGPEATIRVPWRLPLPSLRHRVVVSFGLRTDVHEGGRQHEEVLLRWQSGSRLLPDFRGTMRFRIEAGRTRILVHGTYGVPLGTVGRWFDRLIGRQIARASLQELADRVAKHLADRERLWRAAHG